MYRIGNITADAKQQQTLTLPDGSTLNMTLRFVPMQYGWFANLSWGSFTVNGLRLCNSPNILNKWRNILPFGMACFADDGRDPQLQGDLVAHNVLYILTHTEVAQYSAYLQNGR